ncbi:Uncharacterised protein [BD1-7 clade bacterium]|uniref:Uncharacterized protein n=1 Tax=BD1-7 clade bacterium TaxID=2029982 RepID=A0A5S9QTF7_9GAMM|nr:Uncharacterised protein [BD1-7 clade bacterium]
MAHCEGLGETKDLKIFKPHKSETTDVVNVLGRTMLSTGLQQCKQLICIRRKNDRGMLSNQYR